MKLGKLHYKKMTLEELVTLAQQEDFKALEEIVRREQKNIFATFTYLHSNNENIYDLTQEALLRMAKALPTLKNPKTFKSWLNQIVMHLFYDDLRKLNRIPPTISIDDDRKQDNNCTTNPHTLIPDKRCKPLEHCLSNELDCVIKREMRQLPDYFRVPIVLRELQGLSYDEIAKITNTNVGTVKSRIARARSRLKNSLKEYI